MRKETNSADVLKISNDGHTSKKQLQRQVRKRVKQIERMTKTGKGYVKMPKGANAS